MSERVVVGDWDAPQEVLPATFEADAIYLLPAYRDNEGRPAYRPESMILQKSAAAGGVHLEYALPEDDRQFVDFFSADGSALQLWLAVAGPITDIFLFGLGYLVNALLRRRGSGPDAAAQTPLKLRIARLDPVTGRVKGLQIEGNASDVIEAIRELKADQ